LFKLHNKAAGTFQQASESYIPGGAGNAVLFSVIKAVGAFILFMTLFSWIGDAGH